MFTEIVLIILPIIVFYSSLMSIKRKAVVVVAFSTRIPYDIIPFSPEAREDILICTPRRKIAFAIMHLLAYSKFISSRQPAISIVPTVAWQRVLLSFSLMSATTPLLKGFTQDFRTAGGPIGYFRETVTTGGGSGTSRSYELRSLTKTKSKSKASPQDSITSQSRVTWAQLGNVKPKSTGLETALEDDSRCYHESASIASHDSRQIMIKREWKVSEEVLH